ncbi:hypothetical protein [Arthrobacter sp. HLT1-21]
MSGQVGNNWFPLTGVSVLFVGGAAAGPIAGDNTGAVAAYFVIATLLLILLAAPWLVRNPPAINANSGTYLVLAVVLELAALLGGSIAVLRGLGGWIVLGLGLAAYGLLERGRVMVTAGVFAVLAGVVAVVAHQSWLTLALQLLTAAVFALAAGRLRHLLLRQRRAPDDALETPAPALQ